MASPTDELIHRLLSAAAGRADEHSATLLSDARAEAEAEVKATLKSAIKAALLRSAVARLEQEGAASVMSESPTRTEASRAIASQRASDTDERHYIYGVSSSTLELPTGIRGVDETDVAGVIEDDLQAIVSHVPADFAAPLEQGSDGNGGANDIDQEWLGREVLAHDSVLRKVLSLGPVVPFRFGTAVRSQADVRRLLAAGRDEFRETLQSLTGRKEWGVKIFLPEKSPSSVAARLPGAENGSTGGRAYLSLKRQNQRISKESTQAARAAAEEWHRRLSEVASRAVTLPLRQETHKGAVLNGAYLIADADFETFRQTLETLASAGSRLGITYELTGPWPAYNFVGRTLSVEAA
jgi:hypothetical protein